MRPAVLYITYDRVDYTVRSLPCLLENTDADICVYDNGSKDATVKYLRGLSSQFYAYCFAHSNRGVGAAMNWFLNLTKDREWVAKVDNDTVVPPGWIDKMIWAAGQTGVDALQAKHYFTIKGIKNWQKLTYMSHVIPLSDGTYVLLSAGIGGSGLVLRRKAVTEAINDRTWLMGWGQYQRDHPELKRGFYDGVWVDILDKADYNERAQDIDINYMVHIGRLIELQGEERNEVLNKFSIRDRATAN